MRHGKKFNHLGRKKGHRDAMLSNMANSLILHKRIFTTTAKAKALRVYVEPLLTKSKDNTTHSRRVVFGYLKDKEAVHELYTTVAPKIADRPGGYTRILKTHNRLGDNADMCMMELVDFNELMLEAKADTKKSKSGSKRTRRAGKKTSSDAPASEKKVVDKVKDTAENVKEKAEEVVAEAKDTAEDVVEEVKDTAEEVVDKVADAAEDVVDTDNSSEEDSEEKKDK